MVYDENTRIRLNVSDVRRAIEDADDVRLPAATRADKVRKAIGVLAHVLGDLGRLEALARLEEQKNRG